MTMRERIARAIYEKRNGAGAIAWGRRETAHKEPYLSDADAALAVMAEPTTNAQGIAWFETTFGVPLGDMPGRLDVESVRNMVSPGDLSEALAIRRRAMLEAVRE